MKDGPMKEHMEREDESVVKSMYITYRKRNGMLVKETSIRHHNGVNDYTDSYIVEPIIRLENTDDNQ